LINLGDNLGLSEVSLQEFDASNGVHGQKVDGQNSGGLTTNTLTKHLRPTSGCRPQVDNVLTGFQKPVFFVDF
jgi:hypothetical protein